MKYHFIAIGGSAMHNLAIALHQQGDQISGSDDEIFDPSRSRLEKYGLLPAEKGWFPGNIHNELDAVIAGMHAKPDNPELTQARELGIPVYSYPEFLYTQSKKKTRVVIGGSHGKTTITSMVLHVLKHQGINADFMVGAQLKGFDVMVKLSHDAKLMVMEGDEYPSGPTDPRPKFHVYKPHIAVISGIAWDHINVFSTFADYLAQFGGFIRQIQAGGKLIFDQTDETVRKLCQQQCPPTVSRLPYQLPEFTVHDRITRIRFADQLFPVGVFGRHNLLNMEAARLVCEQLGVQGVDFFEAMLSFHGASKRMQILYDEGSRTIIHDFAHAPSKLRATIHAVRQQYPEKRLIACMELHTYSSLSKHFLPEYQGSMDEADAAIVFFSPQAIQLKRLPQLHQEDVLKGFGRKDLQVITEAAVLEKMLAEQLADDDTCLLLMSSGAFGGIDIQGLLTQDLG